MPPHHHPVHIFVLFLHPHSQFLSPDHKTLEYLTEECRLSNILDWLRVPVDRVVKHCLSANRAAKDFAKEQW